VTVLEGAAQPELSDTLRSPSKYKNPNMLPIKIKIKKITNNPGNWVIPEIKGIIIARAYVSMKA